MFVDCLGIWLMVIMDGEVLWFVVIVDVYVVFEVWFDGLCVVLIGLFIVIVVMNEVGFGVVLFYFLGVLFCDLLGIIN